MKLTSFIMTNDNDRLALLEWPHMCFLWRSISQKCLLRGQSWGEIILPDSKLTSGYRWFGCWWPVWLVGSFQECRHQPILKCRQFLNGHSFTPWMIRTMMLVTLESLLSILQHTSWLQSPTAARLPIPNKSERTLANTCNKSCTSSQFLVVGR